MKDMDLSHRKVKESFRVTDAKEAYPRRMLK